MVDVRGDVLRPPHGTIPAAVKATKNHKMSSFKCNENIHKKKLTMTLTLLTGNDRKLSFSKNKVTSIKKIKLTNFLL